MHQTRGRKRARRRRRRRETRRPSTTRPLRWHPPFSPSSSNTPGRVFGTEQDVANTPWYETGRREDGRQGTYETVKAR